MGLEKSSSESYHFLDSTRSSHQLDIQLSSCAGPDCANLVILTRSKLMLENIILDLLTEDPSYPRVKSQGSLTFISRPREIVRCKARSGDCCPAGHDEPAIVYRQFEVWGASSPVAADSIAPRQRFARLIDENNISRAIDAAEISICLRNFEA